MTSHLNSCVIYHTEGSKSSRRWFRHPKISPKLPYVTVTFVVEETKTKHKHPPKNNFFKKKGWVMDQTHTFGQIPHKFPPIRFVNLINSWQQMSSQLKSVSKKNGWEEWRGIFKVDVIVEHRLTHIIMIDRAMVVFFQGGRWEVRVCEARCRWSWNMKSNKDDRGVAANTTPGGKNTAGASVRPASHLRH